MMSRLATRVLVTGPDVTAPAGAGVWEHVRGLVNGFVGDERFAISTFAVTGVTRERSAVMRVVRVVRKWLSFCVECRSADLVHINASLDTPSLIRDTGFAAIAEAFRVPVILQFHGGRIDLCRWATQGLAARILGRVLRRSTVVAFLSVQQQKPVVAVYELRNSRVVSNYVDSDLAPYNTRVGGGLRVVFLSRLTESKGVLATIAGFVAAEIPESTLTICGVGKLMGDVRSASAGNRAISYAGFLAAGQRARLLMDSDVLVLPSTHAEGLPYCLLEAAAAGNALVATAQGAIGDLVVDGVTGVLLPSPGADDVAAALARLGADAGLLERMKTNARELAVRRFSFEAMREEIGGMYMDATKASSP
jgi:glycosyltransferase involved in cell wall biosynthesis